MSKKPAKSNKQTKDQKKEQKKEWPVVVYMWAIGMGVLGYLVVGEAIFEAKPHPIHWLAGLLGAVAGVPLGWLWYRWRGDVL